MTFTYDGAALGDAPLARKGSSCAATLTTRPAPGSAPGPHTVGATDPSVSATYTVDPAPVPAPPGPVRAPPSPSPTLPPASPSDAPGAQSAVPSATGGGSGSPSAGVLAGMPGRGTSDGGSATPWVLGGAALFILVDLAILALLSRRGRRGGRRRALPDG
jgi:hypothetical protein